MKKRLLATRINLWTHQKSDDPPFTVLYHQHQGFLHQVLPMELWEHFQVWTIFYMITMDCNFYCYYTELCNTLWQILSLSNTGSQSKSFVIWCAGCQTHLLGGVANCVVSIPQGHPKMLNIWLSIQWYTKLLWITDVNMTSLEHIRLMELTQYKQGSTGTLLHFFPKLHKKGEDAYLIFKSMKWTKCTWSSKSSPMFCGAETLCVKWNIHQHFRLTI